MNAQIEKSSPVIALFGQLRSDTVIHNIHITAQKDRLHISQQTQLTEIIQLRVIHDLAMDDAVAAVRSWIFPLNAFKCVQNILKRAVTNTMHCDLHARVMSALHISVKFFLSVI